MSTPFSIRATHRFAAPPERVFDAWLDPAKVPLWFGVGLGPMTRISIDARVGGRFSLMQRRGDEDVDHVGEYLEIDRPRRLAFTWAVPKYSDDVSRVAIDFTRDGGGTLVTLTHEMDPKWQEYEERTRQGWSRMLAAMENA